MPVVSYITQYCRNFLNGFLHAKDAPACSCGLQVVLEIKGETQLMNLASKLHEAGVQHKLWVEQPENFPTCLATAPLPKEAIQQHFKKLKLCKGS